MKVQNIGVFWAFLASVQVVISDKARLLKFEDDNEEANSFSSIMYDAAWNTFWAPALKVSLNINTRETSSMENIPLPIDERDGYFMKSKLDSKKPIVFIIHGFLSRGNQKKWKDLANAYLKRKDAIVFIVDWSTGALHWNYNRAVENTRLVANELASFINFMREHFGTKASNIHLIGHSLGAHVAGFVGKNISHINRITGLDPAHPGFSSDFTMPYGFPDTDFSTNFSRLSKTDAKHVDVIHTNSLFGLSDRLGDVDFYVNGGKIQPGCDPLTDENPESYFKNTCSHSRSVFYFTEAIMNPECQFVACKSRKRAKKVRSKDFNPKQNTILGLKTFKYKLEGKFHIVTNSSYPYCQN